MLTPSVRKQKISVQPNTSRIPLIPFDYLFDFKRSHFPVKLCIAMVTSKAHGQSLKVVGTDLSGECFSHGQL
jgi:hypothetical protein